MDLESYSSLGRRLDFSYLTNRIIIAVTGLVFLGSIFVKIFTGMDWLSSIGFAAWASVVVFLTWAICRELDPDHDWSAFVAAGLVLIGFAFLPLPGIVPLFWLLLTLRIVNRTAGPIPTTVDSIVLLGFAMWLTWTNSWIFGLITGLALIIDGVLPSYKNIHSPLGLVVLVVTGVKLALYGARVASSDYSWVVYLLGFLFIVVYAQVVIGSRHLDSVSDRSDKPLNSKRVQTAQGLAMITGLLIVIFEGSNGLITLTPLWASFLGAGLYKTVIDLRKTILI